MSEHAGDRLAECPEEFDALAAVNSARLMREEGGNAAGRAAIYAEAYDEGTWGRRCADWTWELLSGRKAEADLVPEIASLPAGGHNPLVAVRPWPPRRPEKKGAVPREGPPKAIQMALFDEEGE